MQQGDLITIKELTQTVGGGVTPRMVRHYHQLGLLAPPRRSRGNYRLYGEADIRQLARIVALKQQGFQLNHIRQLLRGTPSTEMGGTIAHLQQQYWELTDKLVQLRQTATALEGLLGCDEPSQPVRDRALARLRELEVQADELGSARIWDEFDAATGAHPEDFHAALQQLLPDLQERPEIEVDLLRELVLACGDTSLVSFVRLSPDAIAAARTALKQGNLVIGDIPTVAAAFDRARLAHLGCSVQTLLDDPHITSAGDAEQQFWQQQKWRDRLASLPAGCVLAIGYSPSVLMAVCEAIAANEIAPALAIGMPIGFGHAPATKRRLQRTGIPFVTISGTQGGGLLAAVTLNALAASLIEKPNCHCYLRHQNGSVAAEKA
ncbi:precorrin isomerase [Rubidibacter lacunae KORDI 51-2]|uniref:Precorrin isomerase n=2 Tax=Rubidibacter TaxID=582491 RepID=U5DSK4_9CHRO|nr:precorrin isomerase [Rubidibacter lacunae KORDI 51-2]